MARPCGVLDAHFTWNVSWTLVFHVPPLPFQLPALLLAVARRQFRLGGGSRREAEGSETGRDFDVWGGWLEDRRDHGFLHGWAGLAGLIMAQPSCNHVSEV
jgi:hypothetical protein